MEALDVLLNRVSTARLQAPAPSPAQREVLFRAALRAPDHGYLRPWRFLCIEDAGRERLGELFAAAVLNKNPQAPAEALAKARNMPLRAPLLVAVIASPKASPKVPESEQVLAASCAAHGILLAAHAQGLGAIWRTGDMAHDRFVADGLGLAAHEQIVAFLYLGSVDGELRTPPELNPADFVASWG
ncbi:nitroreductase family protein [Pseudomonas sp. UL073]|uniref:Putative NAD(P)H nitroreductase n=1 Tax=Zestomonas insulae TaxID=2809017 RepID=A0ABS2IFA2_9GAMM|nr:nitroreductase family protein [Pseudomonas insulae]MBM7060818.1 nitroreductase family protein [Pseudomonas insulae]